MTREGRVILKALHIVVVAHQFFHRGPTWRRSLRARCGSAGGTAGYLAAGGTASGSCWRSISPGCSPPTASCSPGTIDNSYGQFPLSLHLYNNIDILFILTVFVNFKFICKLYYIHKNIYNI